MQTANIMLALGGDTGTTVPKYDVTVSEIAVLQAIHGNSAINEIEPTGTVERSHREEIKRLAEIYGRAKVQGVDGDVSVISSLFPGAAARAFVSFDELEIDDSFFKATSRAKPPEAKAFVKAPEPENEPETEIEIDDYADDEIGEPGLQGDADGELFG